VSCQCSYNSSKFGKKKEHTAEMVPEGHTPGACLTRVHPTLPHRDIQFYRLLHEFAHGRSVSQLSIQSATSLQLRDQGPQLKRQETWWVLSLLLNLPPWTRLQLQHYQYSDFQLCTLNCHLRFERASKLSDESCHWTIEQL